MKSKLKFIFYVLLFSFISASCSFVPETGNSSTMVTINLSNLPTSHSITDDEKAAAKFNIYTNGALAAENISNSFMMEAKVGDIINIRIEALVDGKRIASGKNTITVAQGNNVVYIVLLEDRETPEPQPEPEPEPTVKYTVSYELADGTWNPASPPATEEYSAGEIVTIIRNEPTKQDYTFDGWRAVPDTLNPVDRSNLRGGGTFTMPASNVTLTAQWTSSGYDVIEISTVDQLKDYAEKMKSGAQVTYPNSTITVAANKASYKLTADLDLGGNSVVLSSAYNQFAGDFDGNGYKIKNLSSSDALFHDVAAAGIIRNLILESVNITSDYGQQSPFALTMNGKLIGCQVSGSITARYGVAYGLAAGSGSVAGCLSSIDSNSVSNLYGDQTDVYGAAFSTALSPSDLNAKISQWNNLPDVQNDSRLKCDWHFVDASTGGVALEKGAP